MTILRIIFCLAYFCFTSFFLASNAHSYHRYKFLQIKKKVNIYYPSLGVPGYYTLIVYSTSWCGPCEILKRKYSVLLQRYSNLYIQHIEYTTEPPKDTRFFLSRLQLKGYPAYILLNPQGYPLLSDSDPKADKLINKLDHRKFKYPLTFQSIKKEQLFYNLNKYQGNVLLNRSQIKEGKFPGAILSSSSKSNDFSDRSSPSTNIKNLPPPTINGVFIGIGIVGIVIGVTASVLLVYFATAPNNTTQEMQANGKGGYKLWQ